jgi:O-antigen/teichoic acid export membrane protein
VPLFFADDEMSLTRSSLLTTARSFLFAGTGASSAVLLLVLLIVAGRVLGDEAYGRFSFALALATILEVLMDFGLKEVVTRNVARDRGVAGPLVAHVFGVKAVLSCTGLVLLCGIAVILRPEPEVRAASVLLGVSAVLRSYLLTVRHLLNGLERFGLDSVVLVSDRALLLGIGIVMLKSGSGVVGLSAGFVVARLLALLIAFLLARSQIGSIGIRWNRNESARLLREAAPFGVFIAVLNLYSYVDTLMLGVLRTDQETGLYSAAHRIYEGIVSLASIMGTVAGPRLAYDFVRNRHRHAWLARIALVGALAAAVPIATVVALIARPSIETLFGTAFAPAAPALRLLVAGLVFVFPLQVMHAIAISVNEERVLVRAAVAGCVLNLLLNAALIPGFGMMGSALATVISEGVSLVVILLAVRGKVWRTVVSPIAGASEGAP